MIEVHTTRDKAPLALNADDIVQVWCEDRWCDIAAKDLTADDSIKVGSFRRKIWKVVKLE